MAHAAYELAKLTTKSKQIDGMGFGGGVPDNLIVAGALAFCNPETGKKLPMHSQYLARYVYCDDASCKPEIINRLLFILGREETKVKPETLEGISEAALKDFAKPSFKHNKDGKAELDSQGQPIIKVLCNAEIASHCGIKRQSFSDTHEMLYNQAFMQLCCLISDVDVHMREGLKEDT